MGNQASTAASNTRDRSESIQSQQKAAAAARAAAAAALARRIEEWEQLNAAMTAHEHAAALSCTALSCYWIKQCVGLTFELPFRWAYHSCCFCTSVCCCVCPDSHATHHLSTVQEYSALANIMAANLLEPCHPTYIYTPHVELTRPPYPAAPSAHEENMVSGKRNGEQDGEQDCCDSVLCCCGFFECDEKDCCEIRGCGCLCCCGSFSCGWTDCGVCCLSCTPIEQPFYRELRSLLCVFSCCSACHCGRCCGPDCHFYETVEQRHRRWAVELEADMIRRTEAFMQSYTPKKYAFRKSGSGRLVASTHLAAPAPQTIARGDAAETENVVVSVKT